MGDTGTDLSVDADGVRSAGNIGFWAVIAVAVVLGVHPPGTTELYSDGGEFLEHVDGFWVVIHVVAAVVLLVLPVIIAAWAKGLAGTRARLLGQWAVYIAVTGVTIGVVHLVATDTTTFLAFSNTFASGGGSEAVTVAADLLLRIHAATLTAWVLSLFVVFPVVLGLAARADGRFPMWFPLLAWLGSLLALASIAVTLAEEQWTTLSEMGLFRPAAVLLVVWLVLATWWMRRGSVVPQRGLAGAGPSAARSQP